MYSFALLGFNLPLILFSLQKSICCTLGSPKPGMTPSTRTQWYDPRATTSPCWPPWSSMTPTLAREVERAASGDTPSPRWRPAWRRVAQWSNPRPVRLKLAAHPAWSNTLQRPRPLQDAQVGGKSFSGSLVSVRDTEMYFKCTSHGLNMVKMVETFFISAVEEWNWSV